MAHPHGSYLTLGRARGLSWLDLRQSWALGISEKVVKKCHLLLHFLNFLCMFVEDMFAYKLRALGRERRGQTRASSSLIPQTPSGRTVTFPSYQSQMSSILEVDS